MENTTGISITKRDYKLSLIAGLFIGLLTLPVLKAAKPALYDILYLAVIPFFLIGTPVGLRVAFLIGKKIAIVWQIAKFGLIGVLNTLVDLGVLAFLTFIARSYWHIEPETVIFTIITFYSIYKSISFIVANINSYYWNKHWTFDSGAQTKTRAEFLQFFAVSIVGFFLNVFIASFVFKIVLVSLTGLSTDQLGLIGAAAGSIAGLAWNFIGYKLWVFKK